jgi:hypothetical protein
MEENKNVKELEKTQKPGLRFDEMDVFLLKLQPLSKLDLLLVAQ